LEKSEKRENTGISRCISLDVEEIIFSVCANNWDECKSKKRIKNIFMILTVIK